MRQNPHVRICGGPGSETTLVYPTATWPNGSMIRAWSMSVAHRTIPRPRARSSAGTRPSRTGSCWCDITIVDEGSHAASGTGAPTAGRLNTRGHHPSFGVTKRGDR